jgi:hypothetical protein
MDVMGVLQWMLENKYLYNVKGVYKVTNRFLRDTSSDEVISINTLPSVIPKMSDIQIRPTKESDTDLFKQFMKDADIPFRITSSDGGQYTVKTTSKEAVKAYGKVLRKIEKGEVNYLNLVYSTKMYYKNEKLFRQTILNYLSKGTWEFEYQQFVDKASKGSAAIQKHITEGLGGSSFGEDI